MRYLLSNISVLLCAAVFLFTATAPPAEETDGKDKRYLYEWTDDSGVPHITDSLENVPEKYRARTRQREEQPAGAAGQEQQVQEAPSPLPRGGGNGEEAQKAYWQERMRNARRQLEQAEKRLQELEQQKGEIWSKWGAGVYAPPQEALDQIKQIDQDIELAKKDIDEARNMVEDVIPDEARRAGVPPGWLRE